MTESEPSLRSNMTRLSKFGLHSATYFVAFLLAYELRRALPFAWWMEHPDAPRVFGWAILYSAIGGLTELLFRTERAPWRFASVREALSLCRSVTVTTAIFLITTFVIDRGLELPRSVPILALLISMFLLVGLRVAWRLRYDSNLLRQLTPTWLDRNDSRRTPLLVVGSMAAADRQIRAILSDPNSLYQPVEVVTPEPAEVGLRLHGVPCRLTLGAWKAESVSASYGERPYAVLFLDDPVQAFGLGADRIGELRSAGHALLRPQSLVSFGGQATPDLREIPLEDFLARDPVDLDLAPVRALVAGKRCLVTGAGGSIGSEICRQLLALGCSRLIMVDHSEFLLFEIGRELERVRPDIEQRAVLANVRDGARITELLRTERPEIVFHAAALKHVSLVENNPEEGALTNVLGTWNVLTAAIAADAGQFMLISTDKAVAPSNVMGASKRLAEALLHLVPKGNTRLSAVRFGNVLGSAGSVIPIFRDQIARGGPVTVTDPDVSRFFMTIPEAVQLVLHTTALSATRVTNEASKFLLEMGEPVKIVDLARQMITLSGFRPDQDVKIVFTGLKDGEKMAEILFDADEEVVPCVDGIMEVRSKGNDPVLTQADGSDLTTALVGGDREMITSSTLRVIRRLVGNERP